jgi:hypothetical protein
MSISLSKRIVVHNKTNGRCWYCGIELVPFEQNTSGKNMYTVDHMKVYDDHRDNSISNLVPACRSCNSSKCHKDLEDYRKFESMKKGLMFTENQRSYWLSQGISLPEDRLIKFWSEEQGLQS